jgi:hypothetical protein
MENIGGPLRKQPWIPAHGDFAAFYLPWAAAGDSMRAVASSN